MIETVTCRLTIEKGFTNGTWMMQIDKLNAGVMTKLNDETLRATAKNAAPVLLHWVSFSFMFGR